MMLANKLLRNYFSTLHIMRGKPSMVQSNEVKLRGLFIKATTHDAPTMIFFPQIFDKTQNWINFFTNSSHKILEERNVYILYPRNFGNSDRSSQIGYQQMADDVNRFMYQHKISMATLAGHGIGAKLALAVGCYHPQRVTGVCAIDSTPMNQFYFQPAHELRNYLTLLQGAPLRQPFSSIHTFIKNRVKCPKWRSIFESNLSKVESNLSTSYEWSWNFQDVYRNLSNDLPSSMWNWRSDFGLFTGRSMFIFPEYSRYVHLSTNTLPMMKVCPQLHGWNEGISSVQGDENPLNHWIYDSQPEIQQAYAYRIKQFLKNYDGVHVLLKNREEVGCTTVPDIANARNPRDDFPSQYAPAHYYHNWRFKNVYQK